MTRLVIFSLSFWVCSVQASTHRYDLSVQLSRGGKTIGTPRFLVSEGEITTVTERTGSEHSFIEVVANETATTSGPAISLQFAIGTVDPKGNRNVESQPSLVVKENQSAQIAISQKDLPQTSLTVLAKRAHGSVGQ